MSSTRRMDLRRVKSRQKLICALSELLATKHLEEISIREITDKAGVARVTFYSNYSDRQSVITEWLSDWIDGIESTLDADADRSSLPPAAQLRQFLERVMAHLMGHEDMMQHVLSGRAGDNALQLMREGFGNALRSRTARICGKEASDNEIRFLSIFFGSAVMAALDARLNDEINFSDEEFVGQIVSAIDNGMSAHLDPHP